MRIQLTFGSRYKVRAVATTDTDGAAPGTVVRQNRNADFVTVFYAPASKAPPSKPAGDLTGPVVFTIANASPVPAGEPLVFRISRAGNDGRSHLLNLYYSGDGLLVDPPASVTFEPQDGNNKDVSVPTSPNQSSDADHVVQLVIRPGGKGTQVSSPSAEGTITPPPSVPSPTTTTSQTETPPPAHYTIRSLGAVNRGHDLRFIVSRTGAMGDATVPYQVSQDGATAAVDADKPPAVEFRGDQSRAPLVIEADQFDASCGGDVTVSLSPEAGGASATGTFRDPPGPDCVPPSRPWWEIVIDWFSNHLWLPLGVLGVAAAAGVAKAIRPRPTPHADCTILPGAAQLRPVAEPLSRWPEMRAEAVLEPGPLQITQPLPKRTNVDG